MEHYSIWLLPCEEEAIELNNSIEILANDYDAPIFQSHCTLLSSIEYDPTFTAQECKDHMKQNLPITLRTNSISHSNNFWKSVYVNLESTRQLKGIQSNLSLWFKHGPYDFNPHLSLIYKKLDQNIKQEIATTLRTKNTYTFDRIILVKTGQNIQKWETILELTNHDE